MTPTLPRLLRPALHLLLALSVLLQAGTAVAMRTGMALGAASAVAEAPSIASTSGLSQAKEQALPPCHAIAMAVAPDTGDAGRGTNADTGMSCCGEGLGGVCEWACAQVVPPASPIVTVGLAPGTGTRAAEPRSGTLGTPLSLLLRPPIG